MLITMIVASRRTRWKSSCGKSQRATKHKRDALYQRNHNPFGQKDWSIAIVRNPATRNAIRKRSEALNIQKTRQITFNYLPSLFCARRWLTWSTRSHTHLSTRVYAQHVLNRGRLDVRSTQVRSADLDLTVRRTCDERRRRWLKKSTLPETSSRLAGRRMRRRCIRVQRGPPRLCTTDPRPEYLGERTIDGQPVRYALSRTCDWKCRTARRAVRSELRWLIKRNELRYRRTRMHITYANVSE